MYSFGIHQNLTPPQLFLLITVDETCKELGIEDAGGVAMVLLGQPIIKTRGKFAGAVKGTSVASIISRRALPFQLKHRILPTVTSFKSLMFLRIKFTKNLGAFVGRAVPGVGWVILGTDVSKILYRSVMLYQQMVSPKDRI